MSSVLDVLENIVDSGTGPDAPPRPAFDAVREFLANGPKGCYVDGAWIDDGPALPVHDPGTGAELCVVRAASEETVDAAVRAARGAFATWRRRTGTERGEIVRDIADAIEQRLEVFALLEALDTGKRYAEARDLDIPFSIGHLRYFAGWASKVEGSTIPLSVPDMLNYTIREPVGVVAGIVPWNFPLVFAMYKVAAPIGFGNTVCLKPAEQTPLTALYLASLLADVGVPPGVVNVLPGLGESVGAALVAHPGVNKVAFTGSVPTGKAIARSASDTLKRVSLELGGKSPNIIFEDADLEAATAGAFMGIFANHGQVCTAGSRLFVQRKVYEDVVGGLVDEAGKITLGHGLASDTTMGPLVSAEQRDRVSSFIEAGQREDAVVRHHGSAPADPELSGGYYVPPTVFEVGERGGTITREEIFGPVLAVSAFDSLEEIAARANDTTFGLAAGIWTSDLKRAHRLAAMLDCGTVWVNTFNMFDPASPIGGRKLSGIGRELGRESIELYTETKSVWVDLG